MYIANRILVLAPHTDDAEFGCGASLVKFIEQGIDVFCVAFSAAEESVPNHLPSDTNRKDMLKAMEILGIRKENIQILNYPVRNFPAYRQEILDDLLRINKDINPDLIFLPSTYDTHQDHQVLSQEGFRAFKKNSIFGYELTWNNLTFTTDCFINVEEKHVSKKIESLKCYLSQLGRAYITEDFLRSLMRTRGGQIGENYAEAFEVIRFFIK